MGTDDPEILETIESKRIEEIQDLTDYLLRQIDENAHKMLYSELRRLNDRSSLNNIQESTIDGGRDPDKIQLKDIVDEIIQIANSENIYSEYEGLLSYMKTASQTPAQHIIQTIPNVQKYADPQTIPDEQDISELREGDLYYELLRYADLEPSEFSKLNPIKRRKIRELASEELTELFNEFWRQEDIDFEIEFGNGTVSLLIANKRDETPEDELNDYDLPSYRSEGFRYFLSFFVKLLANSDNLLQDNLILLDDAGVHLHPDAQKDLRESLERLAEDNQIIMATHSPFLINSDDTSEIRLVDTQGDKPGTRVMEKMSQHDASGDDAFASVRAVIGAGFADSLFANKRNILVEGTTDETYLKGFSEAFEATDYPSLDDDKTAVIDSMGASKMGKYAKIFEAEGYEYVCLFDSDTAGEDHSEDLKTEYEVSEEHIHLLHDSIPALADYKAEIEDLISTDLYLDAVVAAHEEIDQSEVGELEIPDQSQLTNEVNREFGPKMGGINKREVARTIADWAREDDSRIDHETEDNFATLITHLIQKIGESVDSDEFDTEVEQVGVSDPAQNGA
ncbi:AAA family ATPase [Halorubrum distributum]|uniref:AAA family ATPase n=1 Tax=Halorubrum distributum TaxID=29283 RepID=UPI0031F2E875